MKFSIIIPTFKEETHLPLLLKSIKKQEYSDYEIIVVDNKSPDKTRAIAQKFNCIIVDGGMPGVARNKGSHVAKGDWLLFFDADVIIPPKFLSKLSKKIDLNLSIIGATTYVKPISKHPFDWLFFIGGNIGTGILQYIKPVAHGFIMIVKKDIFKSLQGFNEKLVLGEDFDLATRIGKKGKFKVFSDLYIKVSVRRFKKEGRFKLFIKLLKSTFLILFFNKKIKKANYDFGHYK